MTIAGALNDTVFIAEVTSVDLGSYVLSVSDGSTNVSGLPITLALDNDEDGLADTWEQTHFGNLNQRGSQDFDSDGISNVAEFEAGTDPTLSTSGAFSLSLLPNNSGTIGATPAGANQALGSTVTLTPQPKSGVFREWGGDASGSTIPFELTMNGAKSVSAIFDEVVIWPAPLAPYRPRTNLDKVVAFDVNGLFHTAVTSTGRTDSWSQFAELNAPPPIPWDIVDVDGNSGTGVAIHRNKTVSVWPANGAQPPAGLSGVIKVSGSTGGASGDTGRHLVALKDDGSVVCWGYNLRGQCNVPATAVKIVDVAATGEGTLALRADGTVLAWGRYPEPIPAGLGNVQAIAAGTDHVLALKRDGTVTAWGSNSFGQCDVPAGLANVIALAAGKAHSLALKADGTMLAWGADDLGQLQAPAGLTKTLAIRATGDWSGALFAGAANADVPLLASRPFAITQRGAPFKFPVLAKHAPTNYTAAGLPAGLAIDPASGVIAGIALSSGEFSVSLSTTNSRGTAWQQLRLSVLSQPPLYGWGDALAYAIPPAVRKVTSFSSRGDFGLAVYDGGQVSQWTGPAGAVPMPANLTGLAKVASSETHAIGLKEDGTAVCWGSNSAGESTPPAGLGGIIDVTGYTGVAGIGNTAGVSLALLNDGTLTRWGSAAHAVPSGLTGIVQVEGGRYHCLARKGDGTVVQWGSVNPFQSVPAAYNTPPAGLAGVIKVAAGTGHSVALKADGTVVCWGYNTNGESTPPAGLADAIDIAAGDGFTLALRRTGQVVGWGDPSRQVMQKLGSVPPALAIATGAYHAAALTMEEDSLARPWIANPYFSAAAQGHSFHGRVLAQNGPASYSAYGLPPGLAVNGTSGDLVGTPTLAGTFPVMLQATNASGAASRTISLTVLGTNSWAEWLAAYGLSGADALPDADPEGDGVANIVEYMRGNSPIASSFIGARSPLPGETAGGRLSVSLERSPNNVDVTLQVEASNDLTSWTPIALSVGGDPFINLGGAFSVSEAPLGNGNRRVTVVDSVPIDGQPKRFMRVSAAQESAIPDPDVLVDLRGLEFGLGAAQWRNRGTLGGFFDATGAPKRETLDGAAAVNFDGQGEYFSGPAHPSELSGGARPHSVEVWAWNGNIDPLEPMVCWGQQVFSGGGSPGALLVFGYGNDASTGAVDHWGIGNLGWAGALPARGHWHHLVYVYDGAGTKIYADGQLARTSSGIVNLPFTRPIRLGAINNAAGSVLPDGYSGALGRVRIFRTALTGAQVMQNYTSQLPAYSNPAQPQPLTAPPLHRYSFDLPAGPVTDGTILADSIGGAAATVRGSGAISAGGRLDLPGGSPATAAYVDLPNGLFSPHADVTLEMWVTIDSIQPWSRLVDIGVGTQGEILGPGGSGYFGSNYVILSANRASAREEQLSATGAPVNGTGGRYLRGNDEGIEKHVVLAYSSSSQEWRVYQQGLLMMVLPTAAGPPTLNDVNAWLGRSNMSGDSNLDGKYNEVRIYNRVLSQQEILGNLSAGPDEVNLGF